MIEPIYYLPHDFYDPRFKVIGPDGSQYKVERLGSYRWYDRFRVYSEFGTFIVHAVGFMDAVDKACEAYVKGLEL
jgi:hypothetical protein